MTPNMEYKHAFLFEGGQHGCLLLHGFTGSPGHMRWLGEKLHEQGYTVSAPLLPGHGLTLQEMRRSNWHQWLETARTSYVQLRERCETVTVMGLSMGGTLSLLLAEEYPVDSLVCMSAAMRLKSKVAWAAPLVAPFVPYSKWGEAEPRVQTRDFLEEYDCGYVGMPLAKVRDLRKLCRLAESNLFAIVAPTLVIQPVKDETVHPKSARIIFDGISSRQKELLMLPESGHVCTLDCDRDRVLYAILQHLHNIAATKSLAI